MKNLIKLFSLIAILFTVGATTVSVQNSSPVQERQSLEEYNRGWKDGYCEGYKDIKGQFAICPLAPLPPVPEVGLSTYKGGYNRGFKRGTSDAKR